MGHLISALVFAPLAGAVLLLALSDERLIRWITLAVSLLVLALTAFAWVRFDGAPPANLGAALADVRFHEQHEWIHTFGVWWDVGLDGVSLLLVGLTALLTPVVVLASWKSIDRRVKGFHVFVLLLEAAMIGAFVSLDAILFYVFWELMLVPMYFLIGIWGGQRRIYAAVKFFLYTAVGSLLMLVAILFLYLHHRDVAGSPSARLADLLATAPMLGRTAQRWLFAAFALSFAIKVPLFPFHTWLPDAHTEAPTGGSVILAGVLLKMGTYGFLRWAMPLFPLAAIDFRVIILTLGAIGVVYGSLVALVQPDMKRLVAYSSVAHLGFVMIGLFAFGANGFSREAVEGAVLQMVNHGLSTGALFLLVGVLYDRKHTREISRFGGLAKPMPMYAFLLLLVTLSSIGLPGTNGFVGEYLILLGGWRAAWPAALVAASGVVLGAIYMLWLYQRVVLGPVDRPENEHVPDAGVREVAALLPLLAAILWIGLAPRPMLMRMETSVDGTLRWIETQVAKAPQTAMLEDGR